MAQPLPDAAITPGVPATRLTRTRIRTLQYAHIYVRTHLRTHTATHHCTRAQPPSWLPLIGVQEFRAKIDKMEQDILMSPYRNPDFRKRLDFQVGGRVVPS